jgi:pimeloyl-ACP methyl ester carboxylesterase
MVELMRYTDAGTGPPAVLLHEGAGAAGVWDDTRAALGAVTGRTVSPTTVAATARPHVTRPSARTISYQAADDLCDLIADLGDEPVDLVGHSDGGSIALLAAARNLAPLRTVTVVDTHVFADPQTVAAVRAMGRPADWDDRTRAHYEALHGVDWQDVVQAWLMMWTAPGGVLEWDIRPALPDITVPVLVIHDRRDQ